MKMAVHFAFDNERYIREQTAEILDRVERFGSKLYLEFVGKLLYDYHAARVLPGYDPNVKMRLLQQLKDKADLLLCIYAEDIERKKIRADFGITYDSDALKLIDDLRDWGVEVAGVVITRFEGQAAVLVIHAIKHLAGIPTMIKLLPPYVTDSVGRLKTEILNEKNIRLDPEETLIALSISASTNSAAQLAMEKLKELQGCEAHLTHMPTPGDEGGCGVWG